MGNFCPLFIEYGILDWTVLCRPIMVESIGMFSLHRKKRFTSFPSSAGMSLTKLSLGRNNSVMTSLFPPRESLVVTSRLGTGNSRSFFYGVQLVQSYRKQYRYRYCTALYDYDHMNVYLWIPVLHVLCIVYSLFTVDTNWWAVCPFNKVADNGNTYSTNTTTKKPIDTWLNLDIFPVENLCKRGETNFQQFFQTKHK